MKFVLLATALTFLTFSHRALAMRGGFTGGGGGTTYLLNGQYILVDLLTIPELRSSVVASTLKINDPVVEAQNILDDWNQLLLSYRSFEGLVSMKDVDWEFVEKPLPPANRFYQLDIANIKEWFTVAYYSKQSKKVKIWSEGFQKLEDLSKVALFIHEAFRNVQIGWDKGNNAFDELALQEATALFVLCKPSHTLSQYINFTLANKNDLALQFYGPQDELIRKFCRLRYE